MLRRRENLHEQLRGIKSVDRNRNLSHSALLMLKNSQKKNDSSVRRANCCRGDADVRSQAEAALTRPALRACVCVCEDIVAAAAEDFTPLPSALQERSRKKNKLRV